MKNHALLSVLIQSEQTTEPGRFSFNFNRETWAVWRSGGKIHAFHYGFNSMNTPQVAEAVQSGILIRRRIRRSLLQAIIEAHITSQPENERQRAYRSLCPEIFAHAGI